MDDRHRTHHAMYTIIKRYWYILLAALVLAGILMLCYCTQWHPRYRVSGRILVNDNTAVLEDATPDYNGVLSSRAVNDMLVLLQSHAPYVTVREVLRNSNALDVSLNTTDIIDGVERLNDVLQWALNSDIERRQSSCDSSLHFIAQQKAVAYERLGDAEQRLCKAHQGLHVTNVVEYGKTLGVRQEELIQELSASQLKEAYLTYLDEYLQRGLDSGSIVAPTALGLQEPTLSKYIEQWNERCQGGPYQTQLATLRTKIRTIVLSMQNTLTLERHDIQRRLRATDSCVLTLPNDQMRITALQRDYRLAEENYAFLLEQEAKVRIERASTTSRHSIIQPAQVVGLVNGRAKINVCVLILLLCTALATGTIWVLERCNDHYREVRELPNEPLVTLPHLHGPQPTYPLVAPREPYTELLRVLRNKIEYLLQRTDGMLLCVTSTQSGDGKTFFATNLATIYALTGKKTLLVDMDLRKPNIHSVLGLLPRYGLSDYLVGRCKADELIMPAEKYPFDFIGAGPVPPNPGELIGCNAMGQFIRPLREKYDFVIIDTSPIGMVPDAAVIVKNTDLTLYVIRRGVTSKNFCTETLQQINHDVHLVFCDADVRGKQHRYGYGYGMNNEK